MDILNSREKVKRLILKGEADKVLKGELVIEKAIVQEGLPGEWVEFEERRAFAESLTLDLVTISPKVKNTEDFFKDLMNPANYEFPDVQKWAIQTKFFTFAILDGAFERGMRAWEFGEFFRVIKSSPLVLQEWLHSVEKLNLDLAQKLEVDGVDGIILADDVAFSGGLMVHPQILKEYFFPSLLHQVEQIKRMGLTVFYHSDGNYQKVLEDIVQTGFDGLHCIDRNSGMEISEVQKKVGDRLCLWGHLDMQDLEEAAQSMEQLEHKVQSINALAAGKRFILGTNSGLFEGMNIQGLKALYQRF